MEGQKQKYVAEIRTAIDKLQFIISQLDGNEGWKKLMDVFKEQVVALDDSWHLIPVEETKRFMEARAAKMAYSHILNWIEFAKADIEKGFQTIKELESDSMSD
jgi:hypothetical protein